MIYIQSKYRSSRLSYVLDYVFTYRLGIDWKYYSDDSGLQAPVLQYSENAASGFCIYDSGLLKETEIKEFEPRIQSTEDKTYLFPSRSEEFSLDFDFFSAVFYLLSRYEEYLPYKKDIHGRFDTEQSFAFRHGFHSRAIIDEWLLEFKENLLKHFPDLEFRNERFDYELTIDVDMVFSYRGKGFARNAAGYVRDSLSFRLDAMWRPIVLMGLKKDPFDTFKYLKKLEKKSKTPFIYFVLFAKERSQFDKNTKRSHRETQQKIKSLAQKNQLGLHPSYSGDPVEEKHALEQVCKKPVNISRQHYLKMNLPETYENLISAGFTDDYTMGFASIPGYRAGTSRPFRFFNLKENSETQFTIHPFSVMDGSYKDYNDLPIKEVREKLISEIDYLKKYNGRFCMLLHNETMSESHRWLGWQGLIEDVIDYANKELL
ncbi:MAG: hypothetical protein C0592_07180 [Marinilabiliales bacterium]|nr:MAG: hypothetical protein C0592_07180 [Marinilabiliales bacterium]